MKRIKVKTYARAVICGKGGEWVAICTINRSQSIYILKLLSYELNSLLVVMLFYVNVFKTPVLSDIHLKLLFRLRKHV